MTKEELKKEVDLRLSLYDEEIWSFCEDAAKMFQTYQWTWGYEYNSELHYIPSAREIFCKLAGMMRDVDFDEMTSGGCLAESGRLRLLAWTDYEDDESPQFEFQLIALETAI